MELASRLADFEQARQSLLDRLADVDHARLTARPIPGKWTLLEIVEHLAIAERSVYRGLPAYSELTARARSPRDRIRGTIVRLILTLSIPVGVPAEAMRPGGGRSLPEWRAHWDENQRWLRGWIDWARAADRLEARVFHHPIAGPLSTGEAVALGHAHLATHERQVRRLGRLLLGWP